jgi:hypothetical protein
MHRCVPTRMWAVHKSTITVRPHLAGSAKHRIWTAPIQQRGIAMSGMSYVEGPTDVSVCVCLSEREMIEQAIPRLPRVRRAKVYSFSD